jgi:RNA methyltransferase, TrmH family
MITSKTNSRLQFIRSLLQDRKERDASGQFVIEGVRLMEEATHLQTDFQEVYFSRSLSERGQRLLETYKRSGILIEEVEEGVFNSLMDTSTTQGMAAICNKPKVILPDTLDFVIIADQLRDPGNLGTVLRIATAAGAQAVITTRGSVDLFSPKVVRSAMGAHFHIMCAELDWDKIKDIRSKDPQNRPEAYVAAADADLHYWDCDFLKPTLLIIGNEADGASESAFAFADHRVSIPMPGKFESLNAAVAAGILIFEVVRQRTPAARKS